MSRINVTPNFVVGYDRPFDSFFAHLYRFDDDDSDEVIREVDFPTVTRLLIAIRSWQEDGSLAPLDDGVEEKIARLLFQHQRDAARLGHSNVIVSL